jgi:hypothetical protein
MLSLLTTYVCTWLVLVFHFVSSSTFVCHGYHALHYAEIFQRIMDAILFFLFFCHVMLLGLFVCRHLACS